MMRCRNDWEVLKLEKTSPGLGWWCHPVIYDFLHKNASEFASSSWIIL